MDAEPRNPILFFFFQCWKNAGTRLNVGVVEPVPNLTCPLVKLVPKLVKKKNKKKLSMKIGNLIFWLKKKKK